ncbi:MAG: PQQ-binding-like beta-propeller repeat protein [Planctomycetes bacterium]|nr:PQQ-binding-like beta-propeller repeat protein [Planctomycetota bacterium]
MLSIGCEFLIATADAADWPQFRGVNAAGQAVATGKLPQNISPTQHVVWKTPLPPGHASPVIFGSRIFLNAVEEDKLLVLALDRTSGAVLWKTEVPHERLEEIHRIGSHAQCTPAVDGERVVSFFGSAGLFCHDVAGRLLWKRPMGPFKNTFGAGSSPILVGDWVILCQDHDTDSFLTAIDKRTGETVWVTDRSEFPRNYSTPIIWTVEGKKQIVVAATLRVVGYDLETGKELWTARGIARFVSATPVIGPDNTLYVAGWAAGGDEGGLRFDVPPFDDVVAELDKNKNGTFEEEELPDGGPIRMRFVQVDRDKNGSLTREEYEYFRTLFRVGKNVVIAVKPGGTGDISQSHVLWTYSRHVPFCASPVVVDGRFYSVKDGGIVSCLSAATGTALKQSRIEATGDYYSSPVVGDGKLYLLNEQGQLTVISTVADWQVLHTADFEEKVYATPAIVDSRIYLRTAGHLYCFGE